MELIWNYGHSAVTLPGDVCQYVPMADEASLRVILALTDPSVTSAPDVVSALVGATRLGVTAVKKALDFWQKKGIFTLTQAQSGNAAKNNSEAAAAAPAVKVTYSVPEYSSDEIGVILEKRHELADLVDICNQLWGKMLNRHEIGKIVALSDYFAVDSAYLSELFSYAAQENRKSVAVVEKLLLQMTEEGITDAATLGERLAAMRRINTFEGEVRALFGFGSRALTAKEKKMVDAWSNDFGYGLDVVRRAYDVTVDAIAKPAIPYTNAVLDRWHSAGLKTLDDVDTDCQKRQSAGVGVGSTYETDDAFAEALKRSYGADYDKMGLNPGNGKKA